MSFDKVSYEAGTVAKLSHIQSFKQEFRLLPSYSSFALLTKERQKRASL
jgi:hypothetical protein